MVEITSYSLRAGQGNSDEYYQQVSSLTDYILSKVDSIRPIITNYSQFIQKNNHESLRTEAEYVLELLTLGTFWRCYLVDAWHLSKLAQQILVFFWSLRQKFPRIKTVVDALRGVFLTLFLTSNHRRAAKEDQLNLNSLEKLINWLRAAGDLEQEIKRLLPWKAYLATLNPEKLAEELSEILSFADWFKEHSAGVLGKYTSNVEKFLEQSLKKHRWCEDLIFCGRPQVLYHLGMFGAEVMNRAFRKDFINTQRKVVLVPICLRAQDKNCQYTKTSHGNACTKCTKDCLVKQLTELGEKHDFEVYIVFHQSAAFAKNFLDDQLGVIGIGCINNLLSGGWEVKSLGHHAQCVILDYCGCKQHWHDTGIVTDINLNAFLQTMGITNSA